MSLKEHITFAVLVIAILCTLAITGAPIFGWHL